MVSGPKNGIDDGPGRFDRILTHEEKRIAAHCVGEQALVGHELVAQIQLHG